MAFWEWCSLHMVFLFAADTFALHLFTYLLVYSFLFLALPHASQPCTGECLHDLQTITKQMALLQQTMLKNVDYFRFLGWFLKTPYLRDFEKKSLCARCTQRFISMCFFSTNTTVYVFCHLKAFSLENTNTAFLEFLDGPLIGCLFCLIISITLLLSFMIRQRV